MSVGEAQKVGWDGKPTSPWRGPWIDCVMSKASDGNWEVFLETENGWTERSRENGARIETKYYGSNTRRADSLGLLGHRNLYFVLGVRHRNVQATVDWQLPLFIQQSIINCRVKLTPQFRYRVKDSEGRCAHLTVMCRRINNGQETEVSGFEICYF
jgi:hypothetical protein